MMMMMKNENGEDDETEIINRKSTL